MYFLEKLFLRQFFSSINFILHGGLEVSGIHVHVSINTVSIWGQKLGWGVRGEVWGHWSVTGWLNWAKWKKGKFEKREKTIYNNVRLFRTGYFSFYIHLYELLRYYAISQGYPMVLLVRSQSLRYQGQVAKLDFIAPMWTNGGSAWAQNLIWGSLWIKFGTRKICLHLASLGTFFGKMF